MCETLELAAVELPLQATSAALGRLQRLLVGVPGVAAVAPCGDAGRRRLLLSPALVPPGAAATLPPQLTALLEDVPGAFLVTHSQPRPYVSLTVAEVLRALLPAEVSPPAAWEEVGHIVHLNLRSEQLPWARLIGAVILDKHSPRIATVVNKASALTGEHRTFPLQLLAGDRRFTTRVAEAGCTFEVDVAAAYWNSRLNTERARMLALLCPGDTLLDLCAGVGPLVVPAARAGVSVLACDLNPAAVASMRRNCALNNVPGDAVQFFNEDGVGLCRRLLAASEPPPLTHVVANLPGTAPELLGAGLARAFNRLTWGTRALPVVHAYAFSKAANPSSDIIQRCAAALLVPPTMLLRGMPGGDAPGTGPGGAALVHFVRDVAPGKPMMRCSFRLPEEAAFSET